MIVLYKIWQKMMHLDNLPGCEQMTVTQRQQELTFYNELSGEPNSFQFRSVATWEVRG